MNRDIIGPGNGLSPVRHQAITWTNANLLSIRHTLTNSEHFNLNLNIFIQENAFKNVCKMAATLSRARWVKVYTMSRNDRSCYGEIRQCLPIASEVINNDIGISYIGILSKDVWLVN